MLFINIHYIYFHLAISILYRVIVRLAALIRLDMSSSSPPQPQYWLENPFSCCRWAGLSADTPPNISANTVKIF